MALTAWLRGSKWPLVLLLASTSCAGVHVKTQAWRTAEPRGVGCAVQAVAPDDLTKYPELGEITAECTQLTFETCLAAVMDAACELGATGLRDLERTPIGESARAGATSTQSRGITYGSRGGGRGGGRRGGGAQVGAMRADPKRADAPAASPVESFRLTGIAVEVPAR